MNRSATHTHSRRQHVVLWLAEWAIFFALWLLFVGKASLAEIGVGVLAAALAATASHSVWAEHLVHFSAEWRSVAQVLRLGSLVFTGTGEILVVLARHLFTRRKAESLFRAVRYTSTADTPGDETRRALVIAYTTAAPNFVIIDIDRERGYLLFHQIAASEVPALTRRLGAA